MCWLRYGKRIYALATEAGSPSWPADVLGVTPNYTIEIETKISKSDLLNDFESKAAKHHAYKNAETRNASSNWVPTYFYFLVPEELGEVALAAVKENQPKAGILIYSPRAYFQRDGQKLICQKQAQKLHKNKPSIQMRKAILMRMGSELCRNKLTFAKEGLESPVMPHGIIDCVDPVGELDRRAAILGKALHSIEWEKTSPGEKMQLRVMVQKLADAEYNECIYEFEEK